MDRLLWRTILLAAFPSTVKEPILGSTFGQEVVRVAQQHGARFPPESEPDLKLVQLLERFPDVVAILRRPGKDILVVPAGQAEVLAAAPGKELVGIRMDLFEALTQIRDEQAFYNKRDDSVRWGSLTPDPESLPLPKSTLENEVSLRRDFARGLSGSGGPELLAALEEQLPLSAFARGLRALHLQRQWHVFRTKNLLARLKDWATSNDIDWKEQWLSDSLAGSQRAVRLFQASDLRSADTLAALFERLDADDLRRISVPLDLILKAFSR